MYNWGFAKANIKDKGNQVLICIYAMKNFTRLWLVKVAKTLETTSPMTILPTYVNFYVAMSRAKYNSGFYKPDLFSRLNGAINQ